MPTPSLMIFDTHAHYDDPRFDEDREELLSTKLQEAGVAKVMNVAADMSSVETTLALSNRYDNVYAALGVHPDEVRDLTESDMDHIRTLALENKSVRAIGEIGFDYHREDHDRALQEKWFERQIDIAKDLDLPIIVHSREAAADTMRVLAERYGACSPNPVPGVVHCYAYSTEDALRYIDMGFMIGIGGVLTFKNGKKLKAVAEAIPLTSIVLETDAPYLCPEPHRGEKNSSLMLPHVIKVLAEIKGLSPEEVSRVTYENAMRLYRIS